MSLTPKAFSVSSVSESNFSITAAESKDIQNSNWAPEKVFDGKVGTAYSSKGFVSARNDRGSYLLFKLGEINSVSFLRLRARMNQGRPEGFPRLYRIYLSSTAGASWYSVGDFSAQPDSGGSLDLNFGRNHRVNAVKIEPVVLGQAGKGGFYFQMAEASLGNKTFTVVSTCTGANRSARPFAGGTGTLSDPYILCHIRQIDQIRFYPTSHFKMKSDINARETNPTVVAPPSDVDVSWKDGKGFLPIPSFKGTFDGGGFGIYGLYMDRSDLSHLGLFGSISRGSVRNLKLEESVIRSVPNITGAVRAGTLAGTVDSSEITNIKVRGLLSIHPGQLVTSLEVGGVFGSVRKSSLSEIGSMAQVQSLRSTTPSSALGGLADMAAGGIAGTASQSSISDVDFSGSVSTATYLRSKVTTARTVKVGGITADLNNGAVKNALSSGTLATSLVNDEPADSVFNLSMGGIVASGTIRTLAPKVSYPIDSHLIQNSASTSILTSYISSGTPGGAPIQNIGAIAGNIYAPSDWPKSSIKDSRWSVNASGVSQMCGKAQGISGCDNQMGIFEGESAFYSPFVAPLLSWDFNQIWLSTPKGLPSLRRQKNPATSCEWPRFQRALQPLKTKNEGTCDVTEAAKYGGNCENFHWIGLLGDPTVIKDSDGKFKMWFTSGERTGAGVWRATIAYAESVDGLLWEDPKDAARDALPVLSPGTPGLDEEGVETAFVVKDLRGKYQMFYSGARMATPNTIYTIGRATSLDGKTWEKELSPALGTTLPWEQPFDAGGFQVGGVLEPSAIIDATGYHLWYQGFGKDPQEKPFSYARFGYAHSTNGKDWVKQADPILRGGTGSFDVAGVGHVNVVREKSGKLHMFYVGIDAKSVLRIGHATSRDGINWNRNPNNPIIEGKAGSWDQGFVGGPSAVMDGDRLYLYYMGSPSNQFTYVHFARTEAYCD